MTTAFVLCPPFCRMGLKVNSGIAVLVLLIVYYAQKSHRRDTKPREQGCRPPRRYPSLGPLFELEYSYAIHKNLPSINKFRKRHGKTFHIRSPVSTLKIVTIATEDLKYQ